MSGPTHRIRRQRWAVKAAGPGDAFAIRRQLREVWEAGALPAFKAAFDEIAPGPEILRVPRLELSLKVKDVDELVDMLPARIRQELRRLVDAAAASRVPAGKPNEALAAERSRDGAVSHYLRGGNVPWHAAEKDPAEAIRALEQEARASLEAVLHELHRIAEDEPLLAAALFRLLQLLPEDEWRTVADRFLGAVTRPPLALMALLDEISGSTDGSLPRHGRIRLLADLIAALSTASARGRTGEHLGVSRAIRAAVASWARKSGHATPAHIAAVLERWTVEPERILPAGAPESRRTAATRPPPVEVAEPNRGTEEGAFPLAVASAGLVLLHPYLAQLFRTVGLVPSIDAPAESSAAARAAALLHQLATGREEPYELELGFVKVLLGLTPETPLPVAGGLLSDADRAEAEALLHAVIGHWTALKHTSMGALRASFLQRTGLLGRDENGWRLRIEPGPFDVLLDRLPWGIGTVKLPWMSKPIYCEWPTA